MLRILHRYYATQIISFYSTKCNKTCGRKCKIEFMCMSVKLCIRNETSCDKISFYSFRTHELNMFDFFKFILSNFFSSVHSQKYGLQPQRTFPFLK